MHLISLIPLPYRILALVLFAIALVGFGWVKGANHVQNKWYLADNKQTLVVAGVKAKQADATVHVITEYVDRVQVIRQAGQTIIKEVPVYVPPEADSACVLPIGFVRLHNDAAAGHLSETAGSSDAAAAGITLSVAGATIAENYQRCRENSAELIGLQDWVRRMKRIAEGNDMGDEK